MSKNIGQDLKSYIVNHSDCSNSFLFSIWQSEFSCFLKKNLFTDAILISSDFKSFPVHKILLASLSDYFRSLFKDDFNIEYIDNVKQFEKLQIKSNDQNIEICQSQKSIDNHLLFDLVSQNCQSNNRVGTSHSVRFKRSNFNWLKVCRIEDRDNQLDNQFELKRKNKKEKIIQFLRRIRIRKKTESSFGSIYSVDNLNNLIVKANALSERNSKFKVYFSDIDSKMLSIVINFLYTGDFQNDINHSNLLDIIMVFDRLMLTDILKILGQFLVETICVDNCISIYQLTKKNFLPDIESEVRRFILYNFIEVYKNDYDFFGLTSVELTEFLLADSLNVDENAIFEIILAWIDCEPDSRSQNLYDLVQLIRLNYVESEMVDKIKENGLVKVNAELLNYLRKVENLLATKKFEVSSSRVSKYSFMRPRIPGDLLFCFGGICINNSNSIFESYDCRTDRWFISSSYKINKQLAYHSLVSYKSSVYIIEFNALTNKFVERAPMHQCRCYLSSVLLDNQIIVMGGHNGVQRLNTVEKYDFDKNQWVYLKPMNFRRSDASADVYNGLIYVAGGFNGSIIMNTCEFYSSDTNQWTSIASLNIPRSGFRLINYLNELYAIGGNSQHQLQNTVEKYCPKKKKWTFTGNNLNITRSNFASAVLEGKLFVVGGFDGDCTIDSVEMLDGSKSWRILSSINIKRSGLSACVIKGLKNAVDYSFLNRDTKNAFVLTILKKTFL